MIQLSRGLKNMHLEHPPMLFALDISEMRARGGGGESEREIK